MATKPKILSLDQLLSKTYDFLDELPPEIEESFGKLTKDFRMLIYAGTGGGKSNLVTLLTKLFLKYDECLYVAVEEGDEVSMQIKAVRHLAKGANYRIRFTDHTMDVDSLIERMNRKRSEQFYIIDTIQFWNIIKPKYLELAATAKKRKKSLIMISHVDGKKPEGKTAQFILKDAPIKVRIEGFVCDVTSRLNTTDSPLKPFIIWEEGAKKYWGKNWKDPFNKTKTKK